MSNAELEMLIGRESDVDSELQDSLRELRAIDFSRPESFLEGLKLGFESEYFLDDGGKVPSAAKRDGLVEKEGYDWLTSELGAGMVEAVSEPLEVTELSEIECDIRKRKERIQGLASERGMALTDGATYPNLSLYGEIPLSKSDDGRYQALIDYYLENGAQETDLVVKDEELPLNPAAPAMSAAIHSNFQAGSLEEGVKMADYLLDIEPYTVALAGNCSSFGDLETGWNDFRIIPWEESFNTEEDPDKVGLPDEYYQDRGVLSGISLVFDPGEESSAKERLDAAIAENWADSRLKFYYGEDLKEYELENPTVVVEARLASMQDSPDREAAVHGFRAGALAYRMENGLPLLGIEKTEENRYSALKDGAEADSYHVVDEKESHDVVEADAEIALETELDRAREGLNYLGIEDDEGHLDLLEEDI